ncbi:MAG: hypothetical protein IKN42_05750, partial [Elusimicrobia bacterium]|nr:hypothetical protein [Elusimicrobiota bacterium]
FLSFDFYPSKNIQLYSPCGNFYNLLTNSIKDFKTNILENISIPSGNNSQEYGKSIPLLLDTSLYKQKIYLYFGITPVLLFYLPFNLITKLYLTDKSVVFLLACFSFLFSLFLIKTLTKNYKNIPANIKILSLFLIGFCNFLPFMIIHGFIYQVAVLTANNLLFGTFCLFYYYITIKDLRTQHILSFFISLFLCLSVGARPHYILFIPIFLFFIIYLNYKQNDNFKNIFKTIIFFITPCLIYGTIIALYNYLRFDSIFEFGWKYQLNVQDQLNFTFTIKDFIIGLKNNFLLLPTINEQTFFSLKAISNHRIGNEYVTGILWTCPIVYILFSLPNFLKKTFIDNKNNFIFLSALISVIIINIIIISFFGIVIRYIFEFLSLMVILSVTIFFFYFNRTTDKSTRFFLNLLFIFIFVYSVFINISLLFCRENFWFYPTMTNTNYSKIIEFLF